MGRVVGPWWSAAFKALGFIPGTVKEKKIQSRCQKLMLKVTGESSWELTISPWSEHSVVLCQYLSTGSVTTRFVFRVCPLFPAMGLY